MMNYILGSRFHMLYVFCFVFYFNRRYLDLITTTAYRFVHLCVRLCIRFGFALFSFMKIDFFMNINSFTFRWTLCHSIIALDDCLCAFTQSQRQAKTIQTAENNLNAILCGHTGLIPSLQNRTPLYVFPVKLLVRMHCIPSMHTKHISIGLCN